MDQICIFTFIRIFFLIKLKAIFVIFADTFLHVCMYDFNHFFWIKHSGNVKKKQ